MPHNCENENSVERARRIIKCSKHKCPVTCCCCCGNRPDRNCPTGPTGPTATYLNFF